MAVARAAWLLALVPRAWAQVVVMSPKALVDEFSDQKGAIEGSTATFGAPFYGDRVLGRLVYSESQKGHTHCSPDDYNVSKPKEFLREGASYKEVRLINIVMVRRGKCSFTKKVQIASDKGAHAVIIVDKEDSDLTAKDMRNIIVADDGYGDKIRIPSVLISKQDGKKLIDSVKAGMEVIIELAWNLPTNHIVQMDLWMSSASLDSFNFLKDFAKNRRVLNEVMTFTPHYVVFGMDKEDPSVYSGICLNEQGEFCAEDPDGAGPITGAEVLKEDLRQLCIHSLYKKERTQNEVVSGDSKVEYAGEYWDYVEGFLDQCPLDGTTSERKFGKECSERWMREKGIDPVKVQQCVSETGTSKLRHERENRGWSPRGLRINGWRFSGVLDPDLVTRAICSGFIHQPKECLDLIKPRDPTQPFNAPADGVSFGTLLGWLLGTVALAFLALLLYKRYLKKEMRATLREEVMLEVQAQMGEYSRLQGK